MTECTRDKTIRKDEATGSIYYETSHPNIRLDLTKMFGKEHAEYIYSLEPERGLEYVESYFPSCRYEL